VAKYFDDENDYATGNLQKEKERRKSMKYNEIEEADKKKYHSFEVRDNNLIWVKSVEEARDFTTLSSAMNHVSIYIMDLEPKDKLEVEIRDNIDPVEGKFNWPVE
jgi:protease II